MSKVPGDAYEMRVLRAAYAELLREDLSPDRLRVIGAEVEGIRAASAYLRRPADLVNCAAALRILAEYRFGSWLGSLERRPGSKVPSPYTRALKRFNLSYRTAHRYSTCGQITADRVTEYLGPHLELLESAGKRSRQELLFDAALNTLGTIDHMIEASGPFDPSWTGRVLVIVPEGAPATFSYGLLSRYSSGHVEHAVLLMLADPDSPHWHLYAEWPYCKLTSVVFSAPPAGPLSAVCMSRGEAVQERFRVEVEPLGAYYPSGASDDVGHDDGALEP